MTALNPHALVDYHMHSILSGDGYDRAEEMARAAVAMGLTEIGLSEHLDTDPIEPGYDGYDDEALLQAIERARAETTNQIRLRKGVEVCYQPDLQETCHRMLARRGPMDYVIGSVHLIDHEYPDAKYFEERGRATTYRRYMADCLRLVQSGLFDILGHFGYLRRYDVDGGRLYNAPDYAEEIDAVLQAIIDHDMVLEINSGGLRRPGEQPDPGRWTLQRYRELGGEAISMGSDAHRAAHVGQGIGRCLALLQELGFRYVVTFKSRRRRWVTIDKHGL